MEDRWEDKRKTGQNEVSPNHVVNIHSSMRPVSGGSKDQKQQSKSSVSHWYSTCIYRGDLALRMNLHSITHMWHYLHSLLSSVLAIDLVHLLTICHS